jgi:hypothetical protein
MILLIVGASYAKMRAAAKSHVQVSGIGVGDKRKLDDARVERISAHH